MCSLRLIGPTTIAVARRDTLMAGVSNFRLRGLFANAQNSLLHNNCGHAAGTAGLMRNVYRFQYN